MKILHRFGLPFALQLISGTPLPAQSAVIPPLAIRHLEGGQVQLGWPGTALGFVLEQTDAITQPLQWQSIATPATPSDGNFTVTVPVTPGNRFFRLRQDLTRVSASSPVNGETGVAVTRETIVHFTAPLSTETIIGTKDFYATFGGRQILSRVELSSDRTKATLFYLEPLPGSARVKVVLDGTALKDSAGIPVDADEDGNPGGEAVISFDTLSLSTLPGTAVIGKVFASELAPAAGGVVPVNKPLAGVTITVDGMEQSLRAVTDATGSFTLSPVPPGRFFVHIDGRTLTDAGAGIDYPDKAYYPAVGKAWDAVAGVTNNLAGGTGEIFLPLITSDTLQTVSMSQDTTISFPASVTASNPELAGTSITVPANSLFSDNGTRGGKVGIAAVPPDRLPGPLPPGLEMPLVVTIQTDGASNFDRPLPIRFPNLPNPITRQKLPPGAKSALLSFNHDTGRWEIQGPMTVTADGLFVESDPGVGVRQPGWHGTDPRCGAGGGEVDVPPCEPGKFAGGSDEDSCKILSFSIQGRAHYCEQYRFDCKRGCEDCLDDIAAFTACIEFCVASMARCIVRKGECPWPPGDDEEEGASLLSTHTSSNVGLQSVLPGQAAPDEADQKPTSLAKGTAQRRPQSGLHYFAIENLARNSFEMRGTAGANGIALPEDVILAPETPYRIWILEAKTLRVGAADFVTPTSGGRVELPAIYTWPDHSPDTDGDRVRDDGEMIMGTDIAKPDTDNDGIPDNAEIQQGLNPVDGLSVRTGVIATVKTPGAAIDLTTGNDLAITAEGASGISVVDISNLRQPTILAHIDTPGTAQRVAFSGNLVAVADGSTGLLVIDIADPVTARIIHRLNLGIAQAVTASPGIGYVGLASGQIIAVDLVNGVNVSQVSVTSAVQDLALDGDFLYALTDNRLHVISLLEGALSLVGSAASPFVSTPNRRLFVGGGIAYTVHGKGYNTLDVTNPAKPVLLTASNTTQFGWRQIVANGSGLGLAAVGPNFSDDGPHEISLYDLSNPRVVNSFITTFPTPGNARAVSIFNGLAYVADDMAGLQVVNYLPYDAKGAPPTISLTTSFSGNSVEEGKPLRVTANVGDDVQVRNVDFQLDSVKVFTDSAFPFEFRFVPPRLTEDTKSFRLRARAVDTGGNSTWTEEVTVTLLPDTTPPRVTQYSPVGGGKALRSLSAYFDAPVDAATLNTGSFKLSSAGNDGLPGTADDLPVDGGVVSYREEAKSATLSFASPLSDGLYRAVLTTAVADLAGNHLASDYTWQFRVADAVFWIRTTDGLWSDPLNWSTGTLPGANDNVIIELSSAEVTVTHPAGTTVIKSLLSNERLVVNSSILQIPGGIQISKNMTLDRGTIRGGTVTASDGARLVIVNNIPSVLDGVTLNGDLDVTTGSLPRVFIRNGLTVNGSVFVDRGGTITFEGTQTLGSGNIVFGGGSGGGGIFFNTMTLANNTTLTLGPAVVMRGQFGSVNGNGTLINQGLISAEVAAGGGTLTIDPRAFTNTGTSECKNGASLVISAATWNNTGVINAAGTGALTLADAWTNTGTINASGATVNLGGTFTLAQLGTLNRTGGTVKVVGVLNLTGTTLGLNATTGSWILDRGTIQGGTVTLSEGARLIVVNNIPSVLDGVTLHGDLDVTSQGARVFIRNGLTLNGSVLLDLGGTITFEGNQTFGSGSVIFRNGSPGFNTPNTLTIAANTTLTLGPAVVVRGRLGTINGNGTLINQGLISADVAAGGGTLTIDPRAFTNAGTSECKNGASLVISAATWNNTGVINGAGTGALTLMDAWSSTGTINASGATVNLGGTFTLAQLGTLNRTGGTVKLTGVLTLTGDTLALNATTGSWTLDRGTINGGTVTLSEGARLIIVNNIPSVLDGVTLNGDLDVTSQGARVFIRNGLTLNGSVLLDLGGNITFEGNQTLSSGSVIFRNGSPGFNTPNTLTIAANTTLTLGPAVVVRGRLGTINGTGTLINQGLISADVAGGTLTINPRQFTNTGTVEQKNGGRVLAP